jgi:hypothetical protein
VTFDEVLGQALEMLRRRGRVSYRALKVQFQLDVTLLEVLKDEIVEVHQLARDQGGKMPVWTGDTASPSVPVSAPTPDHDRAPMWQLQGKRAEARELLAPIYSWFTEGFDTPDLQEAKALLEDLET